MTSAPTENGKKVLTMAEYIEKEAAIRSLLNDSPEQVRYSREDAADCIRYMDAADVATVRHERGVTHYRSGTPVAEGYVSTCCDMWNNRKSNYCPNCGAKMDGGADHDA